MKLEELKDWTEPFAFAGQQGTWGGNSPCIEPCAPGYVVSEDPFGIDDVRQVIGAREGENDGDDWCIAGQLNDGRWFYITAWCDYTGWD